MRALRISDVVEKVGLARSTIYALARKGQFPSPIKLGLHASGWLEGQLEDWLNERAMTPVSSLGSSEGKGRRNARNMGSSKVQSKPHRHSKS